MSKSWAGGMALDFHVAALKKRECRKLGKENLGHA
jgi:hypothetical protein